MSDKEKQEMLSRMNAYPIRPIDMLNPLYGLGLREPGVFDNVRDLAMTVVGPAKFKGIFKLLPRNATKPDIVQDYLKVNSAIRELPKNQRDEAIDAILPFIRKDVDYINSVYRADILNNPNASRKLDRVLTENLASSNKFVEHLVKQRTPKQGITDLAEQARGSYLSSRKSPTLIPKIEPDTRTLDQVGDAVDEAIKRGDYVKTAGGVRITKGVDEGLNVVLTPAEKKALKID